MLKGISRNRLVGAWCAAVIVIGACGVVAGMPITIGYAALLLIICLVPPAIMLLVWGGAPTQTVAELLYSVDAPSKDPR
jgi:hypothetical protein